MAIGPARSKDSGEYFKSVGRASGILCFCVLDRKDPMLMSPLHQLFLQKDEPELGRTSVLRNVILRRLGEECVCE